MRCLALEYHDIIGDHPDASGFPGGAAASYKLGAEAFDAHLAAIGRRRPAIATAENLEGFGPGVAVLLTFDDGGESALTAAAPALGRHGWPGHFFIATGRIGTPGFLGREGIVALHQAGHVIGSHSRSHPLRFAELSPQAMRAEWSESRMVLEDMLGAEVRTASIPGGQYSRAAAEAAAEAGYRFLFTSEPVMRTHMVAGCRVIGRFTLRSSSTADAVESLVSGRRRERWRQWTIWNAKKAAKAAGGRAYLALRDRLLERRSLA